MTQISSKPYMEYSENYEGTSKSFRTLFFKKSLFRLQTWEQHYFSI